MNGTELCVQPHGFNWHRPDRTLAIDGTRGETWDRGYVQSISNICPVMDDRFYIYYTGFAGDKNKAKDKLRPQAYGSLRKRRDGRRAFEARRLCLPKFRKRRRGRKLTRPLVFSGKYLFSNADAPNGGTETKLRDAAGKPIETSTFENCEGVSADSTAAKMKWRNSGDSELTKTRLYSDAHSL